MKLFFLFLIIVLAINLVSSSLNLDKGKMEYNLKVEEESCQIISLNSEDYKGTIKIRDVWAENQNEEKNLNKYNFSASDNKLTIKYMDTVLDFKDSMDFEICITADEPGNFKGALIFTPEAETNVVIEVGTWIIINSEKIPKTNPNDNQGSSSSGSGGSSGGSGSGVIKTNSEKNKTLSKESNEKSENKTNEENKIDENSKTGITGAVIGLFGNKNTKIISLAVIILVISYFLIYKKRKQNV